MTNLLETIIERQQASPRVLSAAEIRHLVMTTVETALDMAVNAAANDGGLIGPADEVIDPDQIVNMIDEEFTSHVQQYWPDTKGKPDNSDAPKIEPGTQSFAIPQDVLTQHAAALVIVKRELEAPGGLLFVAKAIDAAKAKIIGSARTAPWPTERIDDRGASEARNDYGGWTEDDIHNGD